MFDNNYTCENSDAIVTDYRDYDIVWLPNHKNTLLAQSGFIYESERYDGVDRKIAENLIAEGSWRHRGVNSPLYFFTLRFCHTTHIKSLT